MYFTERDILCIPVPMYHCFGMVLGTLNMMAHGGAIVLPSEGFDAYQTMKAVQDQKCTAIFGVPTMFIAMLYEYDKHGFDTSTLRTGLMSGSVCPEPLLRRVITDLGIS